MSGGCHYTFLLLVAVLTLLHPAAALSKEEAAAALAQRYEHLQFRLTTMDAETLNESYENLMKFLDSLRGSAAQILGVQEDQIVIAELDTTKSFVVQFSVVPAAESDFIRYSKLWAEAVANKSSILSDAFPDFDFSYPPTVKTGRTTTSTAAPTTPNNAARHEDSKSNGGVIAGAVVGSLAAVAAVGGAGYYLKKRADNSKAGTGRGPTRGERSPGADGLTPNGLANINVQGEVTPNPHNFH